MESKADEEKEEEWLTKYRVIKGVVCILDQDDNILIDFSAETLRKVIRFYEKLREVIKQ